MLHEFEGPGIKMMLVRDHSSEKGTHPSKASGTAVARSGIEYKPSLFAPATPQEIFEQCLPHQAGASKKKDLARKKTAEEEKEIRRQAKKETQERELEASR